MEAVGFWILSIVTVVSALMVVLLRTPIHNVLFMILVMIGLAGLFLQLHAEFVAMVQLIVYAGAVMVLFLFVVMLLNLDRLRTAEETRAARGLGGALAAVAVLALIMTAFKASESGITAPASMVDGVTNTELVAKELFTTYLLPFEIASVLLLAAIVGTVILVRRRPVRSGDAES